MAAVKKNVSHKSTATPYVALFDTDGMPIKNTLTGMPLGAYLSNFTFMFDEEVENLATLIFDTGDPDTLDQEALREGKSIFIQWGYIYSDDTFKCSPIHCVDIRDIECTFNDTGTHITLKCIDGTNVLRKDPPVKPTDTGSDGMADYLISGCNKNIGVIIEKFS